MSIPPSLAVLQAGLPNRLVGAKVNLLQLVIEVGTAIDVIELLECELRAAPLWAVRRSRDLVYPSNGGATRGCLTRFAPASGSLADGLDELRHLRQAGTILGDSR
jgi:hypothetical protein